MPLELVCARKEGQGGAVDSARRGPVAPVAEVVGGEVVDRAMVCEGPRVRDPESFHREHGGIFLEDCSDDGAELPLLAAYFEAGGVCVEM